MTETSSQPSIRDNGWTDAIRLICEAEGLAILQVTSVQVVDDEISVHLVLPNGRSRISTYPLAALYGKRSPMTESYFALFRAEEISSQSALSKRNVR
jgi:hypothetical protein